MKNQEDIVDVLADERKKYEEIIQRLEQYKTHKSSASQAI
jgi:uncharacterized protein (DUF302 family)